MLYNLYLVIAQECNLTCSYCYAAGGGFGQPEIHMSEATMRRGLERLLSLAGEHLTLSFFGGEPLLNFTLLRETIDYAGHLAAATGRKLSFALTTNGTLLDDEMLAVIKAHISHLSVSLDGGPAANAGRTFPDGTPAFDRIADNIERLRQAQIPFGLRATVTPGNVAQALATAEFLAGFGAVSVRLLPAQGIMWSPEDQRRLRTVMVGLNRRGLQALLDGDPAVGCEHAFRLAAQRMAGYSTERPCVAGGGILALAADGNVYPCEHFVGVAGMAMGRVDEADFPGAQFRMVADRFARCTTNARPRCVTCDVRDACGGQCYAEAFLATGTIERPWAAHCAMVKQVFHALEPQLAQGLNNAEQAARLRQVIGS